MYPDTAKDTATARRIKKSDILNTVPNSYSGLKKVVNAQTNRELALAV